MLIGRNLEVTVAADLEAVDLAERPPVLPPAFAFELSRGFLHDQQFVAVRRSSSSICYDVMRKKSPIRRQFEFSRWR